MMLGDQRLCSGESTQGPGGAGVLGSQLGREVEKYSSKALFSRSLEFCLEIRVQFVRQTIEHCCHSFSCDVATICVCSVQYSSH